MKSLENLLQSSILKKPNKNKINIKYDVGILINILKNNINADLDLSNFIISEDGFTNLLITCIETDNISFFNKLLLYYPQYSIDNSVIRKTLSDNINHIYLECILDISNYDVNLLADNIGFSLVVKNERNDILDLIFQQNIKWDEFEHSKYSNVRDYFKHMHQIIDRQNNVDYILKSKK